MTTSKISHSCYLYSVPPSLSVINVISIIVDKYLSSLSEMECLVSSLRNQLERYGLHVPIRGTGPREMSVDSLKFFFKQQQKALEDSQNEGEAG